MAAHDTRGIVEPAGGHEHFSLRRYAPRSALEDLVDRHWVVRWDLRGRPPFTQEIVPHPCVNLAIEPGGQIMVHGVHTTRASHRIEGSGFVIGTKFRPGAFAAYAALPAWRLTDSALPASEAFARGATELERALRKAGDPVDPYEEAEIAARLEIVESALLSLRPAQREPDRELVTEIATRMLTVAPATRVSRIAADHGLSPRSLQRLFRAYVGVSPKWVLKRYRIHEAAERVVAGERDDWASMATDLGFADQAHLIRDFRAAVGRSPGEYARACAAA